jgi:hypothetical protein
MGMKTKTQPTPRTLQEWMDRNGVSSIRLIALVREQTGHVISPTMMSFILRGSKRCSTVNAAALEAVTGVSAKTLREWPKYPDQNKLYGKRPKRVA